VRSAFFLMFKKTLLLIVLFSFAAAGGAETLRLKNGTILTGQIVERGEYTLNFKTQYGIITVAQRDIVEELPDMQRITLKGGGEIIGVVEDVTQFNVRVKTDKGYVNVDMPKIDSITVYDYESAEKQKKYVEQTLSDSAKNIDSRAKETAAPFAPPEEIIDWNDLPDHFKESNRNQAANLFLSLVCAGYTFGPAATPAHPPEATEPLYTPSQLQLFGHMEHRRWMIEKYLDGWTRGERDTKNKRRPDLKPWSELDAPTQAKDTAPLASTLRLLKTVSYSIWKTPEDLKNNP